MSTDTEMEPGELSHAVGVLTGRVQVNAATVAYHRGVSAGFMVALVGDALGMLANAKRVRGAAPYTLDQARVNLSTWGYDPQRWEASGVLYGFKAATADRDDADTCSACDNRILLREQDADIATCRTHGTFCDETCADSVCDRGCWLRDDRASYAGLPSSVLTALDDDPPFDVESYHAERYGDEPGGSL